MNKFKKLVGIVVSTAMIAASLMTAPFAAMADNEHYLVDYDFSATGTNLTSDVVVEKGEGRQVDVDPANANTGDVVVDNGALKVSVVSCPAGAGHNMNTYAIRAKIPYSGLADNENLRISFETWDPDKDFDLNWQQFGSLINSEGNIVVWGRRDGTHEIYPNTNRYGTGLGGTAQMLLVGYKAASAYDTAIKPGSTTYGDAVKTGSLNNDNGTGAGGNIQDTNKHTIAYDINRKTGLVTVYLDGAEKGTFYILNKITSSGYLDFRGWTCTTLADTQYIDNVKIEAYSDPVVYVPDTSIPLNYDFETTGTHVGAEDVDVIAEYGVGRETATPSDPNNGVVAIDNGMLKMHVEPSKDNPDIRNQNTHAVRAMIPYSGLEAGKNLRISFDVKNDDGVFNTVWRHFGTLVNSNGKMVVWGRRDTQSEIGSRWNSGFGGMGQIMLVGMANSAKNAYNTGAVPGSTTNGDNLGSGTINSSDGANAGYTGANINGTAKHTICYEIDRETDLVTVYVDGKETAGKFYIMNELTESGYLNFHGWSQNVYTDTNYIDNVKIETYIPAAKLGAIPFTYDFSSSDTSGLELSYGTGRSDSDKNTSTITAKDGQLEFVVNNSNNLSGKDGPAINSYGLTYYNTVLKVPYNGLKEGENLKVSFKYTDNDSTYNIKWSDFGALANSRGEMVVASRRDGESSNRWSTGFGDRNQLLFIGYKNKATTYNTGATPGTYNTNINYGSITNDNAASTIGFAGANPSSGVEHTVEYTINAETEEVIVTVDNKTAGTFYIMNELTESGYLVFKAWCYVDGTDTAYLDDISVKSWKALTVEETNLTETNFDAKTDITLTFANALGCEAADVKKALTIETSDGKSVPAADITVVLSADKKTATVKVAGGLLYSETSYTLTLAANTIFDADNLYLDKEWSKTFVTKFAKGMYISDVKNASVTSAQVSATAVVTNPTSSSAPAWVVLAVYDSTNKLIGISSSTVTPAVSGGASVDVPLTAAVDGTIDKIYLLMWNNADDLVPYHVPVEVE